MAADGGAAAGDLSPGALLGAAADNGPAALASCQQAFVAGLWADVLGFAGEARRGGALGLTQHAWYWDLVITMPAAAAQCRADVRHWCV